MSTNAASTGDDVSQIQGEFGWLLLKSGFRSDFVIQCGGQEWNVHHDVLVARSQYFRGLFHGNWTENTTKRLSLNDEPEAVESVISYLYSFEYWWGLGLPGRKGRYCVSAKSRPSVPMYYPVDGIKDYGPLSNPKAITQKIIDLTTVCSLADRLGIVSDPGPGLSQLSISCCSLFYEQVKLIPRDSFCDILRRVFQLERFGTENGLREFMVSVCVRNVARIKNDESVVKLLETEEKKAWAFALKFVDPSRQEKRKADQSELRRCSIKRFKSIAPAIDEDI